MMGAAGAVLGLGSTLIDKIFPDKEAAAAAKLKLLELEQNGELEHLKSETQLALAQAKINEVAAGTGGWFRAGWRPMIGWVCALALMYQFFIHPLASFALLYAGIVEPLPNLNMETLMTLIFGMLGLGGMRTFEKVNGLG